MKISSRLIAIGLTLTAAVASAGAQQAPYPMDRTVLPIAEPKRRADHHARRARREGAAALRGEGAAGRAQRRHRADRRHRLRPQQRLRRADPHADAGEAGGRRPEVQPLSHHGAVQPDPHGAADRPQSPRQQRRRDHGAGHGVSRQHRHAPAGASRRSPRSCARTATARPPSASTTRRRRGRSRSPVRTTAGRRARASTSSTASSAARPTSGRRRSTTASRASSTSRRPTTTSPST